MKIVDLDQKTDKWKVWRSEGVTATDLTVLTGNSPYKTKRDLFMEKTGQQDPKPFPRHLSDHAEMVEDQARYHLKNDLAIEFIPLCVEHESYSKYRASLDGYNKERNLILEVKYVKADYFESCNTPGDIRADHIDQMQWQLFVANCPTAIYFLQNSEDESKAIQVKADKEKQAELIKLARDFEQQIEDNNPPDASSKDTIDAPGLAHLFNKLKDLDRIKKEAESEFKELKELIVVEAGHDNVSFEGIKVYREDRKGSIDYTKGIQVLGLENKDWESFRRKSSTSLKVSFPRKRSI